MCVRVCVCVCVFVGDDREACKNDRTDRDGVEINHISMTYSLSNSCTKITGIGQLLFKLHVLDHLVGVLFATYCILDRYLNHARCNSGGSNCNCICTLGF